MVHDKSYPGGITENERKVYSVRSLEESVFRRLRGTEQELPCLDQLAEIEEAVEELRWRARRAVVKGSKDDAIDLITDALDLWPDSPELFTSRAIYCMLSEEDQYCAAAEEDAATALQLDPNFAEAYFWRAYARSCLGNVEGAADDFHTCAAIGHKEERSIFAGRRFHQQRLKGCMGKVGSDADAAARASEARTAVAAERARDARALAAWKLQLFQQAPYSLCSAAEALPKADCPRGQASKREEQSPRSLLCRAASSEASTPCATPRTPEAPALSPSSASSSDAQPRDSSAEHGGVPSGSTAQQQPPCPQLADAGVTMQPGALVTEAAPEADVRVFADIDMSTINRELEAHPEWSQMLLARAMHHICAGRTHAAELDVAKALAFFPGMPENHTWRCCFDTVREPHLASAVQEVVGHLRKYLASSRDDASMDAMAAACSACAGHHAELAERPHETAELAETEPVFASDLDMLLGEAADEQLALSSDFSEADADAASSAKSWELYTIVEEEEWEVEEMAGKAAESAAPSGGLDVHVYAGNAALSGLMQEADKGRVAFRQGRTQGRKGGRLAGVVNKMWRLLGCISARPRIIE